MRQEGLTKEAAAALFDFIIAGGLILLYVYSEKGAFEGTHA